MADANATALKFELVTAERHMLTVEALVVSLPGTGGEIGVLPGHLPLITALRPGVLTVNGPGGPHVFAISTGFAEVLPDQVTILTDQAEAADAIDLDAASADLAAAEQRLKERAEALSRRAKEPARGEEGEAQPLALDLTLEQNLVHWHRTRVELARAAKGKLSRAA